MFKTEIGWHSALPQPRQSTQVMHKTSVRASESSLGFVHQKRVDNRERRSFALSFIFVGKEMDIFNVFWDTVLNQGTRYFEIRLPSERGLEATTVRMIAGKFSSKLHRRGLWQVSFSVEEYQ